MSQAIQQTVYAAQNRELPPPLAQAVAVANDKAGNNRTLTRATLYRWLAKFDLRQPNAVELLAPASAGKTRRGSWLREVVAPWADAALKLYQRPQKPSLRWVHDQLPAYLPKGVTPPSYDTLRRFIGQMGNVAIEQGRMGSREIKAIKPFVRRDTSKLWPGDIYMADGHAFDAEVAHPRHGRPFRPEITTVLDTSTRKALGWSTDLAESGLAVLDALRVATQTGGIASVFYVDRGAGYINAMISGPGTGLLSRLGTTLTHSLPYNSQARGIIERAHQSIWVRAAKELPTYIGKDMDAEASNKVHKLTRRDVKRLGASRALMAWPEFVAFAADQVEQYNDRPHRGLPMMSDPTTGKRRHMTPNEAWAKGVQDGADLVRLLPSEADHLFRPQQQCRVLRGEIRLFNNTYFSHELTEYHGEGVNVGFDIHDPSQVWVHDAEGVLLCKAQLDGNRRDFMPESFLDRANRRRAEGRARRLQDKLTEVREELHGGPLLLENDPAQRVPFLAEIDALRLGQTVDVQAIEVSREQATVAAVRPAFRNPSERYEWLKAEGHAAWKESDKQFLSEYVRDPDGYALFAERYELLGLAWSEQDEQELNSFKNPARKVA
ncbi:Mu transposase C-terminal domain-containing protein [Achromobacter seleniivolatilans]|uniref:Mu transposase C-terminal domain-containing protein n=1 Tax=Achromobacter seleniivolatilans TaxID=3047478 RepID=A0ABY9M8X9_9BURK|nr:Mu transposase C-terminal domain-containing protein [Achromobacter sp. R39]WMD23073.1 Mu transposase C-terminal domain-containing protein [Achromobacter sp. R39]